MWEGIRGLAGVIRATSFSTSHCGCGICLTFTPIAQPAEEQSKAQSPASNFVGKKQAWLKQVLKQGLKGSNLVASKEVTDAASDSVEYLRYLTGLLNMGQDLPREVSSQKKIDINITVCIS